jgi:hypothetical protein
MKKSKGESQRIYWQQWLSSGNKSQAQQQQQQSNGNYSRRELITSSAAIRINPDAAKAKDVTQLLRDTLKLSSLESSDSGNEAVDSLVLVGTLYSLPKDYIQFEHEPPQQSIDNASPVPNSMKSSEPFHIIKTLKPDDNPLATRDKMMEHLRRIQEQAPSNSSTISPKVQWYFVPNNAGDPSISPIPSCIELDGYCTSMEEEDDSQDDEEEDDNNVHGLALGGIGADETDTRDGDVYYDLDLLLSRCPFTEETTTTITQEGNGAGCQNDSDDKANGRTKELRRYFQMYQVQPSSSGYLLKQSFTDPHVWRRVHCVLTDDHLWYTTRVPYATAQSASTSYIGNDSLRMGKKHGRISLGRALLLEPNTEYKASPLFRVPHSFEVVSSRGTSHIFRAANRILQRQWIQALTTKIMESFENSLLDHAELIVVDETMARNRRCNFVAVEPLFELCQASDSEDPPIVSNSESMYLSLIQASVLRLGMDIAEYRELCRQVQALLPAKQPIVARSGTDNGSGSHSTTLSQNGHDHSTTNGGGHVLPSGEPLDARTLSQVQTAWETASRLLDRSTHVALEVQQYVRHQKQHQQLQQSLSHSLETHCRHIDYVLTGQHRPPSATSPQSSQSNGGRLASSTLPGRKFPPPMDLFDLLLSELQGLIQATI